MTTDLESRQEAIDVPLRVHGAIAFQNTIHWSILAALALSLTWTTPGVLRIAVGVALACVLIFLLRRAWRIALVIDHDGVRIVNYWRSHYLRWSEVEEIYVRWSHVALVPERVLAFRLKSGGWSIPALATLWPGKLATQEKALIKKYCEPKGVPLNAPERWAPAWF